MYGWGAAEVGKYRRIPAVQPTDGPDMLLNGDEIGSTTGGLAIRRDSVYGGMMPRFLPRDAGRLVSDDPVPVVPSVPSVPGTPVVIVSNGTQPATVAVDDSSGLPWWVWLGGAGVGAWFLFGKGKR